MLPSPAPPESAQVMVEFLCPCCLASFPDKKEIARLIANMCQAAPISQVKYMEFYLVNDGAMARLNQACLGLAGSTNILAFADYGTRCGTLYLCQNVLWRECLLYRQNPVRHFLRLLAHGLAHLHGLEHGPRHGALEEKYFRLGQLLLGAGSPQ